MYLSALIIERGKAVVRAIEFKQGLNLILDKPTDQSTETGNNVGKTTVLRLIDFCLGSEGNDIWQDSEFKNSINHEVYEYLHGPIPVSVTLEIQKAPTGAHRLTRVFARGDAGRRAGPSFFVDDTSYRRLTDYRTAVKNLLFGTPASKPSLRQLAPKFVRSSPAAMSKTLKFLGDYGGESEYEALHLFLFGFFKVEVLEERPRLTQKRKKLERDLQAFNRIRKEGEIEQLLLHLKREVEEISLSNQVRGEVPEIAAHANTVSAIRSEAAALAGSLGRLEAEIASIGMAIGELESEFAELDRHSIESIYREAQRYIPELQHDWNDLTEFVHGLRGRKQRFLESNAHELRVNADAIKRKLATLQVKEKQEIGTLMQSRAFNQALEVREDLQVKLKQLGSLEQDLNNIRELKKAISDAEEQLERTRREIEEGKALLSDRVAIFNRYFSTLSEQLYGEQYLLHFEETPKGSVSFDLTAVGSNVGAGKKASQTAAFDLAYIEFLRETGINFPHFVCHDGVESIHANQLAALLETAAGIEGQLILATLRDKLPEMPDAFIEQNTVLELSQEDKLFKL